MLPLVVSAFLLAGCPDPSLTSNPLDSPDEGGVVVSVCYSPGVTDIENEVLPIAIAACDEAGAPIENPRRWKRTYFVNDCPLFKAMRIAYICRPEAVVTTPGGDVSPLTRSQES